MEISPDEDDGDDDAIDAVEAPGETEGANETPCLKFQATSNNSRPNRFSKLQTRTELSLSFAKEPFETSPSSPSMIGVCPGKNAEEIEVFPSPK